MLPVWMFPSTIHSVTMRLPFHATCNGVASWLDDWTGWKRAFAKFVSFPSLNHLRRHKIWWDTVPKCHLPPVATSLLWAVTCVFFYKSSSANFQVLKTLELQRNGSAIYLFSNQVNRPRGVTRIGGTLGKSRFGVHMFEAEVCPKQMCCIEESTCNIVWTFPRLLQWFGVP